jgi:predicted cobalt transporter CbtA
MVMRVKLVLALFLPALFLALPAIGGGPSPLGLATALTAGIAAAFVVAVVLTGRLEAAVPIHVRTISLRERAQLHVRLRDPDAPGRTRPRAPTSGSAAA